MSSIVGKIIPGYNTQKAAIIMVAASVILFVPSVFRTTSIGRRTDFVASAAIVLGIAVVCLAQNNVRRVKTANQLNESVQAERYRKLSLEMYVWIGACSFAATWAGLSGIYYLTVNENSFDRPWGLLMLSFASGMLGMAVDYGEWHHIAALRSNGKQGTFRYGEWVHTTLNAVTYLLCLGGVGTFVVAAYGALFR